MTRLSVYPLDQYDVTTVVRQWTRLAGRLLFGDRYGLVLFLGTLTFVATYWRIGVFVTDSYAIANALVNVADGHLAVTEIKYSITLGSQPGLWYANGAVYGRNYAHVFLSLPVLWLLEALTFVFDSRLVLVAGYAGLVFCLFDQLGRIVDTHRQFALGGSVVMFVVFVGNLLVAPPLPEKWLAFVSLQVTTMVATAFVGVVLYRLFAHAHGRRIGLLVGVAVVIASPVGFWASIPKRHALTTLGVVVVLASFYFARVAETERRKTGYRALSYASIALLAWLHAMEALTIFAVFVPVDLVTGPSRRPRHLVVVAVVFLIALSPFLLTNIAIAGDPLQPPRSLEPFSGQVDPLANSSGKKAAITTPEQSPTATPEQQSIANARSGANTATPPPGTETEVGTKTEARTRARARAGAGESSDTPTSPDPVATFGTTLGALLTGIISGILRALGRGWLFVDRGISALQNEPERLYYIFVRSGRIPTYVRYSINQQEAIDLALLEVSPLLAALLGTIGAVGHTLTRVPSIREFARSLRRPVRQTDILAAVILGTFVLANLWRLPNHAQLTVRYLVPIVPVGLYGVGRLGSVRRVARVDWYWLVVPFVIVTVVASIGLLVSHLQLDLAIGEAMQLHALLGLTSGAVVGIWALIASARPNTDPRIGAVALSIPAALTTLFLLFTGTLYFRYAEFAIPIVDTVSEWIPVAV